MSFRLPKLNSLIQKELGQALLTEISLPRDALTTIKNVEISADLDHAKVWVSVLPLSKGEWAIASLQKSRFRLQSFLGSRLRLRKIPRLNFALDLTEEKADRINRLLDSQI
ncbi:ribosome-binding factor A [bacterium (Candidatus Torokbacteria) CG09_land_8_20_14_0_10_42_11]|nr:MAG: ribosome-binding factor A [bacterium (Candidatus Torokbacteria) CG09_land_8_20_14_0_10_42_11]